ncbi:MAG: hypothetical protein ACJ8AW_41075 [Rhodopila sp.]
MSAAPLTATRPSMIDQVSPFAVLMTGPAVVTIVPSGDALGTPETTSAADNVTSENLKNSTPSTESKMVAPPDPGRMMLNWWNRLVCTVKAERGRLNRTSFFAFTLSH